jgi:hypothetical protein
MGVFGILLIILAVIAALFIVTFIIYWFNLDMKLVRKIYDKLQPHYDNLEKDRKL